MKANTLTASLQPGANPFTLPRKDPALYHQREIERAEEMEIRK